MIRRLGTPPHQRTGKHRSMGGANCPDLLLSADGEDVVVIGTHLSGGDLLGLLPPGSSVGEDETVVSIPLTVLLDAARDLLAQHDTDQTKETPSCPK